MNCILGDSNHTNAATGRSISVARESDSVLDKLSGFISSHVRVIEIISVALNEGTTRPTNSAVSGCHHSSGVDIVDLVAFIGVPARAEHVSAEVTIVDDSLQDASGGADRREVTELFGLSVNVSSELSSNSLGVGGGSRSLAVYSLMYRFKLV